MANVVVPSGSGTVNLLDEWNSLVYRNVEPIFQGNPVADAASRAGARAAFQYQVMSGNLGVDVHDPDVQAFLASLPAADYSNFTPEARADLLRQEQNFSNWLSNQLNGDGNSVTGYGPSYPFGDFIPTAAGGSFNRIAPPSAPSDIGGFMPVAPSEISPNDPRHMPPPDNGASPPPPPRFISSPMVPSDIGGFIPDVPLLPMFVATPGSTPSGAPVGGGTGPGSGGSSGGGGAESPATTSFLNRLADIMAQQYGGGGGSGGGNIVAVPSGLVETPGASGKSPLVGILVIVAVVGGVWWYVRHKKKKSATSGESK